MNLGVGDLEHLRASTSIVEALNLSREFDGREVVKDLTLSLDRGVIQALLGPNGAGKTTVLRMVSGLMAPSGGQLRVAGGDPRERHIRGQIGWVPASDRSFYLRLSGRQNLTFFGQLHGIARLTSRNLADQWISAVGLEAAGSRPVRLYSHGMVKRLVLARALMCRPEVLVIDEATHDLDPAGADQIRLLVRQAADDGAAVIWATQRIAELPGFADSVIVLDEGSVRFSGSVDQFAAEAGSKSYFLVLEGSIEFEKLEFAWGGLDRIRDTGRWRMDIMEHVSLTEAFAELASRGIKVVSCSEERPDVERAFLRLTGPVN